jgi:hypothetical protein
VENYVKNPSLLCFSKSITKNKAMKDHSTDSSSIFLTGAILLANMDFTGLTEYALKAAIGGAIWFLFKIGADHISEKLKNKKEKNESAN